jgi:dihydroorotate dehydrogenase (fumarate)
MDMKTSYLGLELAHPLVPGASPLGADRDAVRRLVDAGAPAIVLPSLFEEQLDNESRAVERYVDVHEHANPEAATFAPALPQEVFRLGPEEYLEQIRWMKETLDIPVIGSLNGTSRGGWIDYATSIEQAGADALELNLYEMASDPGQTSGDTERRLTEIVRTVKERLSIPVAVKLSPFFTALAHFAGELRAAGADGLVLFNRFYQADIDIENLVVRRTLRLSDSSELLLRLRWLAALSDEFDGSLAASGGVHLAVDAVKAVMCGAHTVQVVSSLLERGTDHLGILLADMTAWLEEREYESLNQMRGSMSLARCPNPREYERANYVQILQTWEA